MNILFLVNYDLASTFALNYLLPKLSKHNICVYFTHKKSKKTCRRLKELADFETSALDKLNNPSSTQKLKGIQQLGDYCSQPIAKLNNVNDDGFDQICSSKTELIISIRHMTILHQAIIKLPKHGVINLHSGLLPNYQGVMASFWAMLNAEKRLGTTLHFIENTSVDRGNIISQTQQICDYSKSYLWNILNLYNAGCKNILEAINQFDSTMSVASNQQKDEGHYYSFPVEKDLNKFNKLGHKLFHRNDLVELNKLFTL